MLGSKTMEAQAWKAWHKPGYLCQHSSWATLPKDIHPHVGGYSSSNIPSKPTPKGQNSHFLHIPLRNFIPQVTLDIFKIE